MRHWLLVIGLFGCILPHHGWTQDTLFTEADFLRRVRTFHPVMQQADLRIRLAEADLRVARGFFDPKLQSSWQQKSFDGKNYYAVAENEIKLPTPWVAQVKGGYDWAEGIYLNPEYTFPDAGQAYIGMSMPLWRGLLLDEGRFGLRAAEQELDLARAEARQQELDLQTQARLDYWEWSAAFYRRELIRAALALSQDRLANLSISMQAGDLAAIDTLEAWVQVQSREIDLQDAERKYIKATQELVVHLWSDDGRPHSLSPGTVPEPLSDVLVLATPADWRNDLLATHPKLRALSAKQARLDWDLRWKRELLKPRIDLEYALLANGADFRSAPERSLWQDLFYRNYKWGVRVDIPLTGRKERAGIEAITLKQQTTRLTQDFVARDLLTKFDAYAEQLAILQAQIATFVEAVTAYRVLLVAEREKFDLGESSVFLLNSREQKLLDAQLKLLKLQMDHRETILWLRNTAGVL